MQVLYETEAHDRGNPQSHALSVARYIRRINTKPQHYTTHRSGKSAGASTSSQDYTTNRSGKSAGLISTVRLSLSNHRMTNIPAQPPQLIRHRETIRSITTTTTQPQEKPPHAPLARNDRQKGKKIRPNGLKRFFPLLSAF